MRRLHLMPKVHAADFADIENSRLQSSKRTDCSTPSTGKDREEGRNRNSQISLVVSKSQDFSSSRRALKVRADPDLDEACEQENQIERPLCLHIDTFARNTVTPTRTQNQNQPPRKPSDITKNLHKPLLLISLSTTSARINLR